MTPFEIENIKQDRNRLRAILRDVINWVENNVAYGLPPKMLERAERQLKKGSSNGQRTPSV